MLVTEEIKFCIIVLSEVSFELQFPARIMPRMQSSTNECTVYFFLIVSFPGENLCEIFLRLSVGDLNLRFKEFMFKKILSI